MRITTTLYLLYQRTSPRLPLELGARAFGTDTAVGAHGIVGRSVAPFGCRFLDGHALRTPVASKHAADRFAHLTHGILAILGVIERTGWRLFDRQHVQSDHVINVYVGPAILAWANVFWNAGFFCQFDQPRHLDALRIETEPQPVD